MYIPNKYTSLKQGENNYFKKVVRMVMISVKKRSEYVLGYFRTHCFSMWRDDLRICKNMKALME
jgi:hypothetical protein